MEYNIVGSEFFKDQYNNALKNEEEQNWVVYTDLPIIGYGAVEGLVDLKYCEDNGILGIPLYANCGACVTFNGDITFVSLSKEPHKYQDDLVKAVYNFLKKKKIKCTLNKNDIMAELNGKEYKVASYAVGKVPYNSLCVLGLHISYNMDTKLIEAICTKPQIKEPKGLKDFGIKAEELYKVITDFLDNYK